MLFMLRKYSKSTVSRAKNDCMQGLRYTGYKLFTVAVVPWITGFIIYIYKDSR